MREECEKYRNRLLDDPGRLYELCEGKSYSNRPVELEHVNNWRVSEGLEPLNTIVLESPKPDITQFRITGGTITPEGGVQQLHRTHETLKSQPPSSQVTKDWTKGGRPGYHLALIFKELGQEYTVGCNCENTAKRMDELGVKGCEVRREELVVLLKENAKKLNYWQTLKIAGIALAKGYAFKLSARGLLNEAIKRAKTELDELEQKE